MDMTSLADQSWPVLRRLIYAHAQIYRLTSGMIGHRFPGGPPMLLLDHVGARSGIKRTTPLVYVEDHPDVVLVASKGGYPRNLAGITTSVRTRTQQFKSGVYTEPSTHGSPRTVSASGFGRRRSPRIPDTVAIRSALSERSRS